MAVHQTARRHQESPTAAARGLRVALVASSYNYIKDGVALTLNRLVAYLEAQGAEVLVFAPVSETPAFAHEGTLVPVPSVSLPARPEYRFALGLGRRAAERLRAFRPHLIHIALSPDLIGLAALRLARRMNVPAVASYHTRFETYLEHYWYAAGFAGLLRGYLRRGFSACREVYVPSLSMIDALVADGYRNNLRLWPRGVDAARFDPAKRSNAWRRAQGISDNDAVVTFVSRLVREKQLDTLAASLRLLKARGVAHRCLIVGDGPERAFLERELPDARFTGFLDGEALATAYASSDVFVFPSETETFGNVTLEAMASGLAAVCADATGSRCLIEQGVSGYLVAPRDPGAFADAIARLTDDAALRRKMGQAARSRSLAFSWDASMEQLLGCYQALLERP